MSNAPPPERDDFTRYLITHRDGTPVDPAALFYVLKLTGSGPHADAARAALKVYADRVEVHLPRVAAACRKMCADEERKTGAPAPSYVASADGEDYRSERTYPDRETALLRAPHDLDIPPGGTFWIGYLSPLNICGDVWMYITDLINALAEDGHPVAPLQALTYTGDEHTPEEEQERLRVEVDSRLSVLADMLAPVIRAWAMRYGVDLSTLWGVTGVEQCTRPIPT